LDSGGSGRIEAALLGIILTPPKASHRHWETFT